MPTVILIDISSQMSVKNEQDGESFTKLQLAIHGLNTLLDCLSVYFKLEFVSLVTFSSHCQVVCAFTREFDYLRLKMSQLRTTESASCLETALATVEKLVAGEWGTATVCNVLLVTHEHLMVSRNLKVPFSFPSNFIVVVLNNSPKARGNLSSLESIQLGSKKIYQNEYPLCTSTVQHVFLTLSEECFSSWLGQIVCGNFSSKITLCPPPAPYIRTTDFECQTYSAEHLLEICGFIELQHLGSPGAVSRHLVVPCANGQGCNQGILPPAIPQTDLDEDFSDDGHTPSFCVLLHGALKVENMAAICSAGPNWYGVLYSWSDSRKKSNLMLSLLEPGPEAVPWLGDLDDLTISSNLNGAETFPIRPFEKRSYSQNCISWIQDSGLMSDIHKILRHARKIPDKTQQFYKELNRVRRAAISLGFSSLMGWIANILERECTSLPGSAHPGCAFQLTHAAGILREPYSKDPKYNIMPMKMSFS